MSGNKKSPWDSPAVPFASKSGDRKKMIAVVVLIIVFVSSFIGFILWGPNLSSSQHVKDLSPSSYDFYLNYEQKKETFLQGFINASSPDYVINASVIKSLNYSDYVVFANFLLVLPLSNVSSDTQGLYSSQIGSNASFLSLNLTDISNTGLEIAQAQGITKTNTYFEIVFTLSAVSPRSQVQQPLYNQTIGEMGFTQNYGDYIAFKGENLSVPIKVN
ncbi:MAG: hypothetical protein ACYCQJ_12935 [Nitrososphaerales archaeon]